MKTSTDVIICIATYNGEKYIREQLNSLLSQTYLHWKAIISDDGSTDATLSIVNSYCRDYPEKFSLVENPNKHKGAQCNFFFLLSKAHEKYIMFCDQDDVWLNDKVELTLEEMLRNESVRGKNSPMLVFTDLQPVSAQLRPICSSYMQYQKLQASRVALKQLLVENVVTGCTVMINQALKQKAIVPENMDTIVMHDWWLALVAAQFGSLHFLDRATILYRQHEHNAIGAAKSSGFAFVFRHAFRPGNIRASILRKKQQAKTFLAVYKHELPTPTCKMLEEFQKSHSGPWFYVHNRMLMCGIMRNVGLLLLG